MKVEVVGKLVEHADGRIYLEGWTFDCDCCSSVHEVPVRHREELIRLARAWNTYSYEPPANFWEALGAWAKKSKQGELCGILGCQAKPIVACTHCRHHYCETHAYLACTPAHSKKEDGMP